jgi:C4-dicarboxylate transporter DctM subunit
VDPIHFGVIMIMNLSIGLITPPVGVNLFVGTKITNISMESTFKYVFTLLAGMLAVLLVITYIPGISLLLPGLMG